MNGLRHLAKEKEMRHRLRLVPLVLAAVLAAGVAVAEPIGSHWTITPFGGFTMFDGKLRFPGSNLPLTDGLNVGARAGWQSKSWYGIEAAGGFAGTSEDIPGGQDYDWMHLSGNLMLTPARGRWGGPFFVVGGGWTQGKPSAGPTSESSTIEFGGGINMWMTDGIGLRFEARDVSFSNFGTGSGASENLHNMVLGVGLTFALGGTPRDTDADGVPDKQDKCPGTPAGAKVDATGCPLDTDGDKVFDGLDQCEATPLGAVVNVQGCPADADSDGVFDGIDTCADTPKGATVDAKGCPADADGDGVLDGIDKCPNTPKGASVDSLGCPNDADADGIPDGVDKCPETPAGLRVDATGCPIEVTEKEIELLDTGMIRLQNVNFETDKAVLLPESYAVLDIVGTLLLRWPELKIEIGGHTDSRGSSTRNQKLSEQRADAVRTYITGKFTTLNASQYSVKGYGKAKPIVPNTNELNMAKNRRVEFVVLNKDVLKKESERRRMLQQNEGTPADSTKR